MIVSIGIDMIELVRIKEVWQKHPSRFLYRHFTAEEITYCRSQADPLPSIAARFAAKEAFQKCWHENHGWQDVWVVRDGQKPRLEFSDRIREEIEERGLTVHLSLTHSRDHAAAVVILEQR
jgi:holo-[acyl-carrier protein] synthase